MGILEGHRCAGGLSTPASHNDHINPRQTPEKEIIDQRIPTSDTRNFQTHDQDIINQWRMSTPTSGDLGPRSGDRGPDQEMEATDQEMEAPDQEIEPPIQGWKVLVMNSETFASALLTRTRGLPEPDSTDLN